jgi:hypothetical protein
MEDGPADASKETYYSVKRDLLQCENRPNTVCIARTMDRQTRRQDAFVIHVLRIVIILITRLVLIVHLCITY